jgi:glycolate oxidase FAD binding subunit
LHVKSPTTALPIAETLAPTTVEGVTEILRGCFRDETAVYPLGGQTSLDFGLPAKRKGVGVSLGGMQRIVDYPARDMTITVEAGVTMQTLAETLACENQFLPVDVPQAARATIGGVIATNWNGPRRYGQGLLRDYVIGISAVDGTGRPFKGGGRVVKNVAGYDFCKLLTGSLGTLGVITQVTLRVKPRPQRSVLLVARMRSLAEADKVLAGLATSQATPTAIEFLLGPMWTGDAIVGEVIGRDSSQACAIVVGLEGTEPEVKWMIDQVGREWQTAGVEHYTAVIDTDAAALWQTLTEFPQCGPSPLALKASLTASGVTRFASAVREIDPQASIQCHAGNGIVIARFAEFPAGGLSRTLIQKLTPIATQAQGHVSVLSNPEAAETTRVSAWGGEAPFALMHEVKKQFDPRNILNPGRFVYP